MAYNPPIEGVIMALLAASLLIAKMAVIKKEYERCWIERICIGGPL